MKHVAKRLRQAMRAAGHDPGPSAPDHLLGGVAQACRRCGAVYRAYVGEPTPKPWSCALHRARSHAALTKMLVRETETHAET